jgi:hypothetical protein
MSEFYVALSRLQVFSMETDYKVDWNGQYRYSMLYMYI